MTELTDEQIDLVQSRICPFCRKGPFRSLASHTAPAHHVTSRDLKLMTGQKFYGVSFTSPESHVTSTRLSQKATVESDLQRSPAWTAESAQRPNLCVRSLSRTSTRRQARFTLCRHAARPPSSTRLLRHRSNAVAPLLTASAATAPGTMGTRTQPGRPLRRAKLGQAVGCAMLRGLTGRWPWSTSLA